MKKFLLLILAATVAFSACSVSTHVSIATEKNTSWEGCETMEILDAMGTPDRIEVDGRDGSILIYESAPDYEDPDYDILDPSASARQAEYAYFYLDDEGVCYRVETNHALPAAPRRIISAGVDWWDVFDWLVLVPLVVYLVL
jgi:hypothetical protein